MKKIFGKLNLNWKKLIIFAILSGIYTAIMTLIIPLKNTSFHDIAVNFEVWILFGIIIITNSKSAKDSALKCFVFFLISQPLVYLIQVPFKAEGFGLFRFYKFWFMWTIFTIPMGFIGYYIKSNKWWSLLILLPILILLGEHYYNYLRILVYDFPYHLISVLFCLLSLLIYPICIFDNKKIKNVGLTTSILIIVILTVMVFANRYTYNTSILISEGSNNVVFDDTYKVYLQDKNIGKVYIRYEKQIENYEVDAEFKKTGKTNLVLEDKNGKKTIFELTVGVSTYKINEK